MSIVIEGWIEKCGPKLCPTWNKRWLVLYDSKILEYFVDKEKTKIKGIIELQGKELVQEVNDDPGKTYQYGFYLQTTNRTYRFAVQNKEQRNEWCKLLKKVIGGELKRKKRKKLNRVQTQHINYEF